MVKIVLIFKIYQAKIEGFVCCPIICLVILGSLESPVDRIRWKSNLVSSLWFLGFVIYIVLTKG